MSHPGYRTPKLRAVDLARSLWPGSGRLFCEVSQDRSTCELCRGTKRQREDYYLLAVTAKLRLIQGVPNEDDGSMNQKERPKVVDKIGTNENTRLILMSFKSRGVGGSTLSGHCPVKADKCCNVRSQPDRMQQCDLSGPVVEPCSRRLSCVLVGSALCTG